MSKIYDVALWRYWPTGQFPYTDLVESSSPLVAALDLMKRYKLKYVARAAVGLPDGTIQRWEKGISRVADPGVVPEPSEGEEEVIYE